MAPTKNTDTVNQKLFSVGVLTVLDSGDSDILKLVE